MTGSNRRRFTAGGGSLASSAPRSEKLCAEPKKLSLLWVLRASSSGDTRGTSPQRVRSVRKDFFVNFTKKSVCSESQHFDGLLVLRASSFSFSSFATRFARTCSSSRSWSSTTSTTISWFFSFLSLCHCVGAHTVIGQGGGGVRRRTGVDLFLTPLNVGLAGVAGPRPDPLLAHHYVLFMIIVSGITGIANRLRPSSAGLAAPSRRRRVKVVSRPRLVWVLGFVFF